MSNVTSKETKGAIIPVEPGLFTLPTKAEGKPHLIGGRCPFCGAVWFPKQLICPKCCREGMEEILLSNRGRVDSFTVIWMKPTGYKGEVPYVLAQVRLPEGVQVRAQLSGVDPHKPMIKMGDEVEMVIEKIYENEEGNEVVCHKFKPVGKKQ